MFLKQLVITFISLMISQFALGGPLEDRIAFVTGDSRINLVYRQAIEDPTCLEKIKNNAFLNHSLEGVRQDDRLENKSFEPLLSFVVLEEVNCALQDSIYSTCSRELIEFRQYQMNGDILHNLGGNTSISQTLTLQSQRRLTLCLNDVDQTVQEHTEGIAKEHEEDFLKSSQ